MQITCDTHLHSNHSHDSMSSLRDICETAIRKGLKVVSTSEHVFFDPRDIGTGYFALDRYLEEVRNCAEMYKGQLKVLSGIEFSEPDLFPAQFTDLCNQPLDTVVGALHWLKDGFIGDPKILSRFEAELLVEAYYRAILKVVDYGGFDSFAHLDLIKRYVKLDDTVVTKTMEAVLRSMVRQGIALEMNTSTIRKDHQGTAASYALVDVYLSMGGHRLTIGSDAHTLEDIAADFDQIPERFKSYLGYFEKRAFIKMVT